MTTIYVKAYVREDGTHVKAHTREIEGATYKERSQSTNDLSYAIINSIGDFTKSTKEEVEMYEELLRKTEEELGNHIIATINSKGDDMYHISSMVRNLDKATKDLTTLKTIREKAGMSEEEPSIFGQPFQIASNSTDGLLMLDTFENSIQKDKTSKDYELIAIKKETALDKLDKKINWKNISTIKKEKEFKLKTGVDAPKNINEVNKIFRELRNKYAKNGENIKIYSQMNKNDKYIVDYIYNNIKTENINLISIDKDRIPESLKQKAKAFNNSSIKGKKDFLLEFSDFIFESSEIFKDNKRRPKILFSNDFHDFAQCDWVKHEITINEDILADIYGGQLKEVTNSLLEEISHEAINIHKNKDNDPVIEYLKNAQQFYANTSENEENYNNNPNEIVAKFNANINDDYINIYQDEMNIASKIKGAGKYISNTFNHDIPFVWDTLKNKFKK